MIKILSITKETNQIGNWKLLNDQPVYITNRQVSGLPTNPIAMKWTLENQEVLAPTLYKRNAG